MVTKATKTKNKPTAKKPSVIARVRESPKASGPKKVDYYPNRMTLAVSALAGTLLVLLALITVLGSQ